MIPVLDALLATYPVVVRQAVQWGDMDAHGHVNNVVYYRYMENARIAYYEAIRKYDYEAEHGVSFVLAESRCRYRATLTYPDFIRIAARVSDIGEDRCTMTYAVGSEAQSLIAAEGEATLVAIEVGSKRKTTFPAELKRRIEVLQAHLAQG